ncbi:MAG: WD40 repeat domain-containing protein, partial [Gemmataceae bacterium]
MFVRSLVAASAAVLLTAVGVAQDQIDRRSRDEPEMTYQTGGRVGTCDVVRFTPDGTFLFAAGDDKVVRGWPATADGLDLDSRKGETLRWPAWREGRGGIKAIAISPDGKRIAVGGVGLITSAVAILERGGTEGKVAALTWPKVKDGGRHFDAVTAIAFDPAGKRVAFGTADGSLWVWTPAIQAEDKDGRTWSAPVLAGRHDITDKKVKQELAEKGLLRQGDFASRLVYFQCEAVVSVCRMGQVLECPITADLTANPDAAAPQGQELFNAKTGAGENKLYPGRVFKVERTADGKGLVVALSEKWVLVQSLDGKTQARLQLPADHFPRSVAVHPTSGKIAVGVGRLVPEDKKRLRFFAEQDDEIWVYDAPKGNAEPDRKLTHPGRAEALTFHPTQRDRLAVAGGDADEVTVYDVAAAKLLAVARGAGRKVFAVEMTSTGKLLRFRTARDPKAAHPNAHAAGDWHGFDLNAVKRTEDTGDAGRTWVGAVSEADGWTVTPDADHRAVWWVTGHGKKARLDIDPARFNDPTCY